jgi:hypothetical protein
VKAGRFYVRQQRGVQAWMPNFGAEVRHQHLYRAVVVAFGDRTRPSP